MVLEHSVEENPIPREEQQAAEQLWEKMLGVAPDKGLGKYWEGVVAMGRLEEFRAYCGTRLHFVLEDIQLLICFLMKMLFCSHYMPLAYRLMQTWHYHDCNKP